MSLLIEPNGDSQNVTEVLSPLVQNETVIFSEHHQVSQNNDTDETVIDADQQSSVIVQHDNGNSILIEAVGTETLMFELGYTQVVRQEVFVGMPLDIPDYPAIIFAPVKIGLETIYELRVVVP